MFPIVVLNSYIKKIDKFDLNSIKWNSIDINCNHNMLSNYWSNIPNNYGIKIGSVNKLVPNLSKKSNIFFFITKIFSCIYCIKFAEFENLNNLTD